MAMNPRQKQLILPWVNKFYKKAFPGVKVCHAVDGADLQKAGIDKILRYRQRSRRQSITVDEKIRETLYPDILLEEYSNWQQRVPGWLMADNALCDYISYIFRRQRLVFLLRYKELKQSWDKNYPLWVEKYKRRYGKTKDHNGKVKYTTSNIPVPLEALGINYVCNDFERWKDYRHRSYHQ